MGKPSYPAPPKIKRAYTTQHDPKKIAAALKYMREKNKSAYAAAKLFGIPRSTLFDKEKGLHPNGPGAPKRLTDEEENAIVKVLVASGDYGSPLEALDLQLIVFKYLKENGRADVFDWKPPGPKWVKKFIKRNSDALTVRSVQNIKRSRAEKTTGEIEEYFSNLKISLEGVPKENIINYDETNLSDNPGNKKCIFRRGIKYPERVMNYTKGAISIMFSITADGECLAPYVVYKAEHVYSQWVINGPRGARFNRTKSGWFDSMMFEDWFKTIIIPWSQSKTGPKVLIGDNLASHINYTIVTLCEANNIKFIFLPPNSSHLTQPLDVCYFGPLKKLWRSILLDYKIKNPREATLNKSHFPELLKKLMIELNDKTKNIISGFAATGIYPFKPDKVLKKLPDYKPPSEYKIDNALLDYLKENRAPNPNKKVRNKKISTVPGKSVSTSDFQFSVNLDFKLQSKQTKNKKRTINDDDNNRAVTIISNVIITPNKTSECLTVHSPDRNDEITNVTRSLTFQDAYEAGPSKRSLPWISPVKNRQKVMKAVYGTSDTDDDTQSLGRFSLLDPSDDDFMTLDSDEDTPLSKISNDKILNSAASRAEENGNKSEEEGKTDIHVNSWVLVKLEGKKTIKRYVGQILECLSPISYQIKFLRHKANGTFFWPVVNDISIVTMAEIEAILKDPSKGRRGTLNFDISSFKLLKIS